MEHCLRKIYQSSLTPLLRSLKKRNESIELLYRKEYQLPQQHVIRVLIHQRPTNIPPHCSTKRSLYTCTSLQFCLSRNKASKKPHNLLYFPGMSCFYSFFETRNSFMGHCISHDFSDDVSTNVQTTKLIRYASLGFTY